MVSQTYSTAVDANPSGAEFIDLGIVESLEFDHEPVDIGKRGQDVCIKVV